MSTEVYIGVDVGTSETKGVATAHDGTVLAFARSPHRVSSPAPGHVEHDAERVWWAGFVTVLQDLLGQPGVDASRVVALSCSGIGPCVLPVDSDGAPLRPAILYGVDTRASQEVEELTLRWGTDEVRQRCGNDLTAQSAGPKIAWLARHEPEVHAATRWFLTCQSFLVLRLTGRAVVDHTTASYVHPFYRLTELRWDVADCADIVLLEQLPDLAWSGDVAGHVLPHIAQSLGLPDGVVVAVGTADAVAEALGSGVHGPGEVMCMYGSSGFFLAPTQQPRPSAGLYCSPGITNGQWLLAGATSTAGSFLRWTAELLGLVSQDGQPDWAAFEELVASAPPGAAGVSVVPHLAGERTPFHDPHARAIFAGLGLEHGRGHVARAALEGVAASMTLGLLAVLEAADGESHADGRDPSGPLPRRQVVAVGGGTQSELWVQTLSDMSRLAQRTVSPNIGAAYGGAMLAAVAHGSVPLVDTHTWARPERAIVPDARRAAQLKSTQDTLGTTYLAMKNARQPEIDVPVVGTNPEAGS